jgi:hypothetical protein
VHFNYLKHFADFTVENSLDPLLILKIALPFTSSPTRVSLSLILPLQQNHTFLSHSHLSLRKHGELLDVKSAVPTSLSLAPGATSETTLSPPDLIWLLRWQEVNLHLYG